MNEEQPDRSLEDRISRLEASVRDLQRTIASLQEDLAPRQTPPPALPAGPASPRVEQPSPKAAPLARPFPPSKANQQLSPWDRMPEQMKSWEYWLNKLGIGLLLFGVVFLFKYSIDRGWITPAIRVASGLGLGVILIGLGLRLYDKRRPFATVLLGGGIATFYITGFASFQFLEVWPFTVAFGFMIATTLLSFILSLKQDEAVLSLIALAGGLGTPFLLYTGEGNLPGLILYTCMLLAFSGGIYFYKGWQTLLWETILGGWIVLFVAIASMYNDRSLFTQANRWAMQGGLAFAWLMFWVVPLVKEIVQVKFPDRLAPERLGILDRHVSPQAVQVAGGHVHLWTVTTSVIAFFSSMQVWRLKDETWGWIAMVVAVLLVGVGWLIRSTPALARLGYTHLLTGLAFFSLGLALLLDGDVLFVALAAEAALLAVAGNKTNFLPLKIYGHVLFGLLGMWFLIDRIAAWDGQIFWTAATMADLFGVLMLAVAAAVSAKVARAVYMVAAAGVLAAIFQRELHGDLLMALLVAELGAFQYIAIRLKDEALEIIGDMFSVAIVGVLAYRLFFEAASGTPMLNWGAAVDLFTLAILVGIGMIHRRQQARFIYRLAGHAVALVLLWKELSTLTNGDGIVSVAWGAYGIVMLVVGLRKNLYRLRLVGMVTLLLTVGKLFLVDLARIETIWRILLFLGFGGIFLLLSYYFRALWKPPTPEDSETTEKRSDT